MAPAIALLSHRGGNIGHDFMAAGMSEAVVEAFGAETEILHFEQHRPFEVYGPGHWIRLANGLRHGRHRWLRRILTRDEVRLWLWRQLPAMPFNLAVACGGPSLVPGASRVPEMSLLLHHMNGAFTYRGVPFVDAAVGAAFPLESNPKRFVDPQDIAFFKTALRCATKVTVRDVVALDVCADLGVVTQLVPCGAIGVGRLFERFVPSKAESDYVVINFQAHGANEDWGQGVDTVKWRSIVRAVIERLSRRHAIRFIAHSGAEAKLAAELAGEFPCLRPTDLAGYAAAIASAKAGFVSRIHAAVALASIGVPSLVVGTDTRLGTAEQFGLPTRPVKQVSAEEIIDVIEDLIAASGREKERLRAKRETTIGAYAQIFREQSR